MRPVHDRSFADDSDSVWCAFAAGLFGDDKDRQIVRSPAGSCPYMCIFQNRDSIPGSSGDTRWNSADNMAGQLVESCAIEKWHAVGRHESRLKVGV